MPDQDLVVVFPTTHLTLKAESALEQAGITYRTIMKPRKISSDCGLAIRVNREELRRIRELLLDRSIETIGFFEESAQGWEEIGAGEGQ